MKIEGLFKEHFIHWAKKREPFRFNKYTKTLICFGKSFFEFPLAFQINAYSVFLDESEVCISIDPYLGGGTPAYFAYIRYRNEHHIDVQLDVHNGNEAEFWTRHEATLAALEQAIKIYESQQPF